jgi:hypothetical protein
MGAVPTEMVVGQFVAGGWMMELMLELRGTGKDGDALAKLGVICFRPRVCRCSTQDSGYERQKNQIGKSGFASARGLSIAFISLRNGGVSMEDINRSIVEMDDGRKEDMNLLSFTSLLAMIDGWPQDDGVHRVIL